MGKIYKFTGYLIDYNDDFKDFEEQLEYINSHIKYGSDIEAFNIEKCVGFECYDNIVDSSKESYDKCFNTCNP